ADAGKLHQQLVSATAIRLHRRFRKSVGVDAPLQNLAGLLQHLTALSGWDVIHFDAQNHAGAAAQIEPESHGPAHDREDAHQHHREDQQASADEGSIHCTPPAGRTVCRLVTRSASCPQASRIGLAMKIDEQVPTMIPTTRTSENPCSTGPPKRSSASAVSSVNPEVSTVRLRVWLMLRLIVSASVS